MPSADSKWPKNALQTLLLNFGAVKFDIILTCTLQYGIKRFVMLRIISSSDYHVIEHSMYVKKITKHLNISLLVEFRLGIAIPNPGIPDRFSIPKSRDCARPKSRDFVIGISRSIMCCKARFTTKIQLYVNDVVAEFAGLKAALILVKVCTTGCPGSLDLRLRLVRH